MGGGMQTIAKQLCQTGRIEKQLLLNCIKLINHGRYIASNETSTNQSPNISRSRSQIEIPNINVTFKTINKLNID